MNDDDPQQPMPQYQTPPLPSQSYQGPQPAQGQQVPSGEQTDSGQYGQQPNAWYGGRPQPVDPTSSADQPMQGRQPAGAQYAQAPQGWREPFAEQPGAPEYGQDPYDANTAYGPGAPTVSGYYCQPGYAYAPRPSAPWNIMCILGFILSISIVVAPVGLALSIIALAQIRRTGEKSRGLAIAGIGIGAVITAIDVLVAILFSILMVSAFHHYDQACVGDNCSSSIMDYSANRSISDFTDVSSARAAHGVVGDSAGDHAGSAGAPVALTLHTAGSFGWDQAMAGLAA